MTPNSSNLIWIDLEMSGLDPDTDCILEIATIVTDNELNILEEGPALAIHQSNRVLDNMDEWNTQHHTRSGLVERARSSLINEAEAEQRTLDFVRQYIGPGQSPMCGNGICQDRRFLHRSMPTLERYFHYRNLDVSTVKELAKRWLPALAEGHPKNPRHQALEDVRDSIRELQYYRVHLFKADY